MDIPYDSLPKETLRRVIEHFVLREGTDYGGVEYSLEEKTDQVYQQLVQGKARVAFDPETETVDIIPR